MKKMVLNIFVMVLGCAFLFGCHTNKQSLDWLKGDWNSVEWGVTYNFSEAEGKWMIKNGKDIISDDAEMTTESTDQNITLVSKDGTQFNIEKKDNKHMMFNQTVSRSNTSMVGTTDTVEFSKQSDH